MSTGPSNLDLETIAYRGLTYAVILLIGLMIILPFLYALNVSFQPRGEVFQEPHWIPREPTLTAWTEGFSQIKNELVNSALIGSGTAILGLLITIPGAYVFGRQSFPGKKFAFRLIIISLMFPYILLIIPITDLWNQWNLYNTIPGLWIAYQAFVAPFALWILRDFFEQLPNNLEEAAQVYGCTQFSAFVRVILPLSLPAIVAVGFVAFLIGWNDFLFSAMLTTGNGPRPAVVSLFVQTTGGEMVFWSKMMAETIMIGLPPTVLYMISRRYLENAFAV